MGPDLRPSPRADCDSSRDYYSDLSTEVGAAVWVYELLLESWNDVASSGGLVLIIMAQVATVSFGAELKDGYKPVDNWVSREPITLRFDRD